MPDPRYAPLYTASQVAALVGEKPSTVANWAFGTKKFRRVIDPADLKRRRLSFVNLLELHVLHVIRKRKHVELQKVRAALEHLASTLKTEHPLASVKMQTDGADLFVERLGHLISASQHGQGVIREAVVDSLSRIERNDRGDPVRFFPVARQEFTSEAPRHIVADPRHRFGRPFLSSSGVPTEVVYSRFMAGELISELAEDYETTEQEIDEAIRFQSRGGSLGVVA